ncbi:hypothetical protein [Legionella drancourtii]|jgi:hypothetical protein|uniref:Uncharacterized protein n=1 Tax=Legionella drancourtii LLAP12 TaxID=658187 RepID=G9EQC2_9GAMM|nr:hypothetical protein [Legionella drancourtii]EHL30517.1 hypothetical protein LDG_7469 [Legionella drancourtii LLAP12]
MFKVCVGVLVLVFSTLSFSSQAELNETLVRIISQINATLPLLEEAKEAIEPNARIQLHIDSFEGADNKQHAGVQDDLLAIRNALIEYINKPAIEPKTVKPLEFDFVGK